MTERDYDSELIKLKKDIETIVGTERMKVINSLIKISYEFDEKPNLKIEHNINE